MNLPSRGERASAGTERRMGFFLEPTRVSLNLSAIYLLAFLFFFRLLLVFLAVAARAPFAAPGGSNRGREGILPPFICFIIFAICLRAFSSWLTCWTSVPLPFAIRSRREPSITCGSARSRGVI